MSPVKLGSSTIESGDDAQAMLFSRRWVIRMSLGVFSFSVAWKMVRYPRLRLSGSSSTCRWAISIFFCSFFSFSYLVFSIVIWVHARQMRFPFRQAVFETIVQYLDFFIFFTQSRYCCAIGCSVFLIQKLKVWAKRCRELFQFHLTFS